MSELERRPDEPQILEFAGHKIRYLVEGDEFIFWLTDLAAALGYRDAANLARRLKPDELNGTRPTSTVSRGIQQMAVCSETGMWRAIMESRSENADPLKGRIAEIMKEIRRTGSYGAPVVALSRRELALAVLAAEDKIDALTATVTEQAPKVEMADRLIGANGDFAVGTAAKILSRDPAIDIGPGQLFYYLRGVKQYGASEKIRWLDNRGRPLQDPAIRKGFLAVAPGGQFLHPRTNEWTVKPDGQIRVKPAGLLKLHTLFGGTRQLEIRYGDDEVDD